MTDAILAQLRAKTLPPVEPKPLAGTSRRWQTSEAIWGTKPRKAIRHDEDDLQTAIVDWFALQYPEFAGMFFAVANGGQRNAREGARLKKQGLRAGVSDLILLVPRPHVLLLEVKVKGGKLSDAQKIWLAAAAALGHTTAVAYDFHAAKAAIVNHIGY